MLVQPDYHWTWSASVFYYIHMPVQRQIHTHHWSDVITKYHFSSVTVTMSAFFCESPSVKILVFPNQKTWHDFPSRTAIFLHCRPLTYLFMLYVNCVSCKKSQTLNLKRPESYCRQLRFSVYLRYAFWTLINSLVGWLCACSVLVCAGAPGTFFVCSVKNMKL